MVLVFSHYQVGVNTRVILVIDEEVVEMINPEITWKSSECVMMEEGCLSVPEHYIDIERPREIKVKFQTRREIKDLIVPIDKIDEGKNLFQTDTQERKPLWDSLL